MNREIKFRGLIIDSKEWVYGYFVKTPITTEFDCDGQFLDSGIGRYCIIQDMVAHEVDINTVGQDTGLLDKNGKEIYEGDRLRHLIRHLNGTIGVVEYDRAGFTVIEKREEGGKTWNALNDPQWEIIGNIYQNPELTSQEK
jgi:uncharacterized phage protein (TIGR01671 family)